MSTDQSDLQFSICRPRAGMDAIVKFGFRGRGKRQFQRRVCDDSDGAAVYDPFFSALVEGFFDSCTCPAEWEFHGMEFG